MFDCVSEDSNGQAAWGIRGDLAFKWLVLWIFMMFTRLHIIGAEVGDQEPLPPFFWIGAHGGGGGINVKIMAH